MSICVFSCPPQAGLIETNGELKVFIDQNLSPSKGESCCLSVCAVIAGAVTPLGLNPE